MMKAILIFAFMLLGIGAYATKTSSIATGNWNASATWDNGVPGCFDTIVVSTGHTVTVNPDVDLSSCSSPIYIIVKGNLYLDCYFLGLGGYELSLPSGSAISVEYGGSINGCGAFLSSQITAGGNVVYDNNKDNTVSGPEYIGEDGTTLPVELLSFTSELIQNKITLQWQTATEYNSEYFEIERSIDGKVWGTIGRVEAAGNSNLLIDYTFTDDYPNNKDNYYRLLQMDFDGKYEYFGPIYQSFQLNILEEKLRIYPNPNNKGVLYISLSEAMVYGDVIEIFNYSGKLVYEKRLQGDVNQLKINISELPKGLYFVHYTGENILVTEKLIIQ